MKFGHSQPKIIGKHRKILEGGAEMTTEKEKILAECRKTLERGRAVATGIGVFAVIINHGGNPLLRRRLEKDSLYGQDLSGKWEMTGGGAELPHFTVKLGPADLSNYQQPIFACLFQELMEEAGLKLLALPQPLTLIPAWLWRPYEDSVAKGERITIDLAFSVPIRWSDGCLEETPEFGQKLVRGELVFVPAKKLPEIDIVSPRTRFLIEEPLKLIGSL